MKNELDFIMLADAYVNDGARAPVTLAFTLPRSDTDIVEGRLLFHDIKDIPQPHIDPLSPLQIHASGTIAYPEVWIPRFRIETRHLDLSCGGVAELLFLGDFQKFENLAGVLSCMVFVQDNALFNQLDVEGVLSWPTPFGQATLVKQHVFNSQETPPAINIELDYSVGKSWQDLLNRLAEYLDELMWLISFLCKKYVHWHQLLLVYQSGDLENQNLITSIRGYREPITVQFNRLDSYQIPSSDLLIKLNLLRTQSEITEKVFTLYKQSSHSEIIKRLISLIMLTYTNSFMEQDLGIVYTALEMLVSHFTPSMKELLKDSKWSKLSSAIKEFISSQDVIKLTSEQIAAMELKVLELNRYPYKNKLFHLFSDVIKLLPEDISKLNLSPQLIIGTLDKAISRRNKYIHEGEIKDDTVAWGDIALVRFIISIWILNLLEYPLGQINENDADLRVLEAVFTEQPKV
jgi:hypothetical protein